MTFFKFFATAAGTGIIAANLWRVTFHLMCAGFTITTHLTQDHVLTLLLPFDLLFHFLFVSCTAAGTCTATTATRAASSASGSFSTSVRSSKRLQQE
jgi:hypothetical protein